MKFRLDLSYEGSSFNGWQSQADGGAVQDYLESALQKILPGSSRLIGASRTDSGVHALHQVASFCYEGTKLESLDCEKLRLGLQALIPEAIGIKAVSLVSDAFHPIKAAKAKLYIYNLSISGVRNPFWERYVWRLFTESFHIDLVRDASTYLIGKHDFSSFCASGAGAKTFTRHLIDVKINAFAGNVQFLFLGKGFLKQMVRIMVGTLVDVGMQRLAPEQISAVIAARNRSKAGQTAPPQGLFLSKIFFEELPNSVFEAAAGMPIHDTTRFLLPF